MRVGKSLFAVVALAGLVSALPKGHLQRRDGQCTCTKTIRASEATSQAGKGAVVYADSSSSSDSGSWDSESGSGGWNDNGSGSVTVQKVVYFNYVPVPVPVVTTCQTTGTIVIENDIMIKVTIAPTVNTSPVDSANRR